jgi:hypothetical protein
MQGRYGRSACDGAPDNVQEVLAPREVPWPVLPTRVQEHNQAPCLWIVGLRSRALIRIASAREGQIL